MQEKTAQIVADTTVKIVCLVTPSFLALLLSAKSDASLKSLRERCSQMRQPRIKLDGNKWPKPWSCITCGLDFSGIGDAACHVTEEHTRKRKQHYKHNPTEPLPHPTPKQRKEVREFIKDGKDRKKQ